jgi:hypothetical protein
MLMTKGLIDVILAFGLIIERLGHKKGSMPVECHGVKAHSHKCEKMQKIELQHS